MLERQGLGLFGLYLAGTLRQAYLAYFINYRAALGAG